MSEVTLAPCSREACRRAGPADARRECDSQLAEARLAHVGTLFLIARPPGATTGRSAPRPQVPLQRTEPPPAGVLNAGGV